MNTIVLNPINNPVTALPILLVTRKIAKKSIPKVVSIAMATVLYGALQS